MPLNKVLGFILSLALFYGMAKYGITNLSNEAQFIGIAIMLAGFMTGDSK